MYKKLCSLLLSLLIAGGSLTAVTAGAETTDLPQPVAEAEQSAGEAQPDFGNAEDAETIKQVVENNRTFYYDENGKQIDITKLNNEVGVNESALESSCDLRDYGRVTSVKDQGSQGLCWSFASMAALESSILSQPELAAREGENPLATLDLSESGESWYLFTNTDDTDATIYGDYIDDPKKGGGGGNTHYIAEALSAGYGAYPESLLPYDEFESGYSEALRFYSEYALKDYSELSNDTALIKQHIKDTGAVAVSYNCFDSNSYTVDGMEAYYDDGSPIDGNYGESHVVAIIGWDDSFSKENFNPLSQPQNDGAFLCKNSWGEHSGSTAEGYEGCFWMSYETSFFCCASFTAQSVNEFDNIYQHYITTSNSSDTQAAASVFAAKSNELMEQVVFSTNGAADVNIKIYKLDEGYLSPVDGQLVGEFNAATDFSGVHAVDCPENIALSAGDNFSVVITSNGEPLQLKYRNDFDGEASGAGFILSDDGEWIDIADDTFSGYPAIKAYTSNADGTDFAGLEGLIRIASQVQPEEGVSSEATADLQAQINEAQAVLNNANATQNDVDNACCLLDAKLRRVTGYKYEINDIEDYNTLVDEINNKKNTTAQLIVLNTDLDFDGEVIAPLYRSGKFTGTFEGNGHTISNFKIIETESNSAGMFGGLYGAEVRNVTFSDCEISSDSTGTVISPECEASTISNCKIINAKIKSMFGSLYTFDAADSTIKDCTAQSSVVYGDYGAGIFNYASYPDTGMTISGCSSSDTKLYSYSSVQNEMLTVNADRESYDYYYRPIITLDDSGCTLEGFVGEIISASSEQAELTLADNKCVVNAESGNIDVILGYEDIENKDFSVLGDIETKELYFSAYLGEGTTPVFPEEVAGRRVTGFDDEFFIPDEIRSSISSITIPGTIETIPSNVFIGMISLKEVVLLQGVKSIESYAFSECFNLTSVTLPDSLVQIGSSAFSNCESLGDIDFGNGLETIGEYAFLGCRGIVDPVLPDSLRTLESSAFASCAFKTITLGRNIEYIGYNAFGATTMNELNYETVLIPDFVVNGYSSTAALDYANEMGFDFVDLDTSDRVANGELFDYGVFLKGDVNLDGVITIADATLLQKWLANRAELNQIQLSNAIIGENYATINIDNVTLIQKYEAMLIDSLDGSAAG